MTTRTPQFQARRSTAARGWGVAAALALALALTVLATLVHLPTVRVQDRTYAAPSALADAVTHGQVRTARVYALGADAYVIDWDAARGNHWRTQRLAVSPGAVVADLGASSRTKITIAPSGQAPPQQRENNSAVYALALLIAAMSSVTTFALLDTLVRGGSLRWRCVGAELLTAPLGPIIYVAARIGNVDLSRGSAPRSRLLRALPGLLAVVAPVATLIAALIAHGAQPLPVQIGLNSH